QASRLLDSQASRNRTIRTSPSTRLFFRLDIPLRFSQNGFSRGCGARGDLGQLAPRKKLLKSTSSFPELSETLLALFGTEGFLFLPPRCPFSLTTPFRGSSVFCVG